MYVSNVSTGRSLWVLFLSMRVMWLAKDRTLHHCILWTAESWPAVCLILRSVGWSRVTSLEGETVEQMSGKGNLKPSRTTKKTEWEKIINIKVREYI